MASVRLFWQGPKGSYSAISQEKVRSTFSIGPPDWTSVPPAQSRLLTTTSPEEETSDDR